ncbi:MAG: tetratricopeptide repeat protein [Candidatus Rifleibacteriota bacterium]
MPVWFKKILPFTFLLLYFCPLTGIALELSRTLREADRLYQTGNYEAAINKAEKAVKISPANLQANLIMGMSYFNNKNYVKARVCFRKAAKIAPEHPIVRRYIDVIQEIEHRYGPFSQSIIAQKESSDPVTTNNAFKKAWFGHSFPTESAPKEEYFDPAKNVPAPVALEVEAPIKRILIKNTVADMAQKALKEKKYLKSYLFYSQLSSSEPSNREYILGKAKSAFQLKRYDEVIKIIGPIILASDKSFKNKELHQQAKNLLKEARTKLYSSDL